MSADELNRLHEQMVRIGPLLSIHFDANKMLVHQTGHVFVFERLAFHDVTPMASRITYAHQYHTVRLFGLVQGFLVPHGYQSTGLWAC